MFDLPTGLNAARLYGPVVQLPPAQATGERLRLHAAFCVNETILSDAWGSAPRVRDPADPAFRRLVSQLTFELLPARDPYDREDRLFCRPPFCS